jgi:hypothetical protein
VDVDASTVDDAAVVDGSDKLDNVVDCSESGTCDTVNLYDGDEDKKRNKTATLRTNASIIRNLARRGRPLVNAKKKPAFMMENCKKSCFLCPFTEIDMGVKQNIEPGYEFIDIRTSSNTW